MKIYRSEKKIANQILENNSIAWASDIVDHSMKDGCRAVAFDKNIEVPVTPDLFFTKSILVSTNWNKNDDVFTAAEVWKARKTPVHKATNINHMEDDIVGHITSTWAIDSQGELIDDNISLDKLPKFFHICNAAVIYKHWREERRVDEINHLIAEIVSGKKYVSMECFFTDFDYAIEKDNELQFVERNEETAFLTKHLRIFGGEGTYNNSRIGRVVKDIVFAGKGYVDKPANNNSVIFDYNGVNKNSSGVYVLCNASEEKMSDNQDKVIADLNAKIDEMSKANESLQEQINKANSENLEVQLKNVQEALTVAEASVEALKENETKLVSKCEDLKTKNDEINKQLGDIQAKELMQNRVKAFVELGYDNDKAEDKVKSLGAISQENFDKIVSLFADRPTVETAEASDDTNSASDEDEDLENVSADTNATTAGINSAESEEHDTMLSSFASYLTNLNSEKNNDGAETPA